jgi:flagellar biosynthesis/type III secretory pathway protein FliH
MHKQDEREIEAILNNDGVEFSNETLVRIIGWAEDLEDQATEAGRDEGYDDGAASREGEFDDGHSEGFDEGHEEGYDAGIIDGNEAGRSEGWDDGHSAGYDEGHSEGYETGFQEGIDDNA